MHSSRSVSRLLALATGAALLALGPVVADAPAVADAPGAAVLRVDTDGDGLDDAFDACPTVASPNPTGCPSASRSVSLAWLAGKQRLRVRVTSPVGACASRARIALWRVRPNRDYKVFGGNVSFAGRLRLKVARGATYYVTVPPSYSSGVAECGQAVSRRVAVPRP
jgi:hypothetical protein